MKLILLAILLSFYLIGCSSTNTIPVQSKPHPEIEDFSKLSDDQLCELSFDHKDPQTEEEIYVRFISCDRVDLTCRKQGFRRNTLAMADCVYKEKLKNQSPNVKACFDSGISKDDINAMTNCLIEKERAYNVENHNVISYDYEVVKDQ